jgi:transcriptional regulator with GAF, ATPase, and Fis domain
MMLTHCSATAPASDGLVAGLEAIIDAATGILAAQSLEETLQGMADALEPIVPYTSLAVYEVDWVERLLTPLLATGSYVEQTLRSRPSLDDSITGSAVLRCEVICLQPGDPLMRRHVMPGTPHSDSEAILFAPLVVGERVVGTLNVWREDERPSFLAEETLLVRRFASLAAMAYANSAQREQLRSVASAIGRGQPRSSTSTSTRSSRSTTPSDTRPGIRCSASSRR